MTAISTADVLLQAGSGEIAVLAIPLLVAILQLAGMWKVFTKANRAGWAAIVPIYNLYVMLKIGDNAWWWLLLLFVPIVNVYAQYKIHAGVARAFGKGIGFGLGLAFLGPIFFPLLGFGGYRYTDPNRGQGSLA
ncbi:MAG: DUF5684 domain-containing protein [Haloarculaceae archaeon]